MHRSLVPIIAVALAPGCSALPWAGAAATTGAAGAAAPGAPPPGVDPTVATRNAHAEDSLPPDGQVPTAAQQAALEVVWTKEIDLRRHQYTSFTPEEMTLYCRNNLRVARALELAYPEDDDRGFALRVEIVFRFAHPAFAECKTKQPEWQAFTTATEAEVGTRSVIPHAAWPKLAACKLPFVILLGVDVNSAGAEGREVIGRSKTVEGYDLVGGIAGTRLEPRVRERDVVTDREDRLAVFTGAARPVEVTAGRSDVVVARCAGKATTALVNLPNKKLAALGLTPIAIGTVESWEWTAW